jgi:hypothetical protein
MSHVIHFGILFGPPELRSSFLVHKDTRRIYDIGGGYDVRRQTRSKSSALKPLAAARSEDQKSGSPLVDRLAGR